MTRQNHILHNPASEIDLPRLGRTLPKNILSVEEVEQIMTQCDIDRPNRLARPRHPRSAVLDRNAAAGDRRLKLFDLSLDRGLILVARARARRTVTCPSASGRSHG
jgi:integrase/recombinase XerD